MTATSADRTAGQFRALETLGTLLQHQVAGHLPPIAWRITTTGTLHGHCTDRVTFFAWQQELGTPDSEHGLTGGSRLNATWDSRGGVQVVLTMTAGHETDSDPS